MERGGGREGVLRGVRRWGCESNEGVMGCEVDVCSV